MKKILFALAVAISTSGFSQSYEVDLNDYYMSYAYSMDYETLFKNDFGVKQEDNIGHNRYIIDPSNMKITFYTGDKKEDYVGEKDLMSFKETSTQITFSFQDVGSISGKTCTRFGVINKNPRTNEPKFVLYHLSKLDNKTTVCYTSK